MLPSVQKVCVWILLAGVLRHKGTVILYVSCVTLFVAVEKGRVTYFFIVLKVFELYVLEHFPGCYLVCFFFVFKFVLPLEDVVL